VVHSAEETPAALERFFVLHTARAEVTGTVAHDNVFATPRSRRFLRACVEKMAQRGQIAIFQLEIRGLVVATRVGFVLGDELYLYFSGYDYAWSRYNVMTTVVAEAIKWAIDRRLKLVHLSTGTDVSKTRWRPMSAETHHGVQLAPTWRSSIVFRSHRRLAALARPDTSLGQIFDRIRRKG
jgi:CelD/BcsL family acetyltransferase involved in cellulose biosynthesis